jgi:hypothetical protein
MGKQGVDGVYDADPHKHDDAVKFDHLTYDDFLQRGLKVADGLLERLLAVHHPGPGLVPKLLDVGGGEVRHVRLHSCVW